MTREVTIAQRVIRAMSAKATVTQTVTASLVSIATSAILVKAFRDAVADRRPIPVSTAVSCDD